MTPQDNPSTPPLLAEEVVSDGLVSIAEACSFLGIGRSLLYDFMDGGMLDSVKLGHRRLIPRIALHRLAAANLRQSVLTL